MKRQAKKVLEEEAALCCCEYMNRHGQRSHVAACCCDCEDLDDACDRWEMRDLILCPNLRQDRQLVFGVFRRKSIIVFR